MITKVGSQIVRGFLMGAADVVPGVSGGTIALITGIYEKLIDTVRDGARALASLTKGDLRGFWRRVVNLDYLFIVPLGFGMLLAIGGLASVIEQQLNDNPEDMAGLFFGLVAASVLIGWDLITRRTGEQLAIVLVVGAVVFFLLGYQSGPVANPSPGVFVGAGALAICAMILPGISGSFILLMIGMYSAVIGAVHDRELAELAMVAVGAVIGLALFSTVLGWILERHADRTMAVLVGLMLGSLRVLWPWPNGVGVISEDETEVVDGTGIEWPASDEFIGPVSLAMVGFVAVVAMARLGRRLSD